MAEIVGVMSNFLDLSFMASNKKLKVDSVANVALERKPARRGLFKMTNVTRGIQHFSHQPT